MGTGDAERTHARQNIGNGKNDYDNVSSTPRRTPPDARHAHTSRKPQTKYDDKKEAAQGRYILNNLREGGCGAKDVAPTMAAMPFHQESEEQPRAYDPRAIAERATCYSADLFQNAGEDDEPVATLIATRPTRGDQKTREAEHGDGQREHSHVADAVQSDTPDERQRRTSDSEWTHGGRREMTQEQMQTQGTSGRADDGDDRRRHNDEADADKRDEHDKRRVPGDCGLIHGSRRDVTQGHTHAHAHARNARMQTRERHANLPPHTGGRPPDKPYSEGGGAPRQRIVASPRAQTDLGHNAGDSASAAGD